MKTIEELELVQLREENSRLLLDCATLGGREAVLAEALRETSECHDLDCTYEACEVDAPVAEVKPGELCYGCVAEIALKDTTEQAKAWLELLGWARKEHERCEGRNDPGRCGVCDALWKLDQARGRK